MNENPTPLRREQNKRLPLMLPADLYEAIARQAAAADRDPIQQARFLLRQAVGAPEVRS